MEFVGKILHKMLNLDQFSCQQILDMISVVS